MLIAKAILWFNPIVYLYDKVLEQNHEYEADETASQNYGIKSYAELLLRLAVAKSNNTLVHNFVKSPIKERIKMLFHDKSKAMKKLMYLLVIPIGLGLIWGFTIDVVEVFAETKAFQEVQNQPFVVVIDAGHGGENRGAQNQNVNEKDITLNVANKVKALAEAQGIKVLLTRSNDTYVSISDRARVTGSLLLSLHVNNDPTKKRNGIEMFTSGNYSETDHKLAKSNGFTYYLYKSLSQQKDIKVNSRPTNKRLLILNQSSMPGVMLEMGYLSHPSDFRNITNQDKQSELARLIVNAIKAYKKGIHEVKPDSGAMKAHMDEFRIKYAAWKKSDKYKALVAETKNFKSQILIGNIQSLNYFQRGKIQDMDGFIMMANNKLYRIFLDKEQLKSISFKVGDKVSLLAPKAEVWFDSEYPAIKPKNVKITPSIGMVPTKVYPKLISSAGLTADTKNNIFYVSKGIMEIGGHILEAEEMIWDRNKMVISAKKSTLKIKDGSVLTGEHLLYNINAGTYKVNNAVGNVNEVRSRLSDLMDKLPYRASDSTRFSNQRKVITLYGKASVDFDGRKLSGDKIEINKYTNMITAYNAEFTGLDREIVRAKVISYHMDTKKSSFKGISRH